MNTFWLLLAAMAVLVLVIKGRKGPLRFIIRILSLPFRVIGRFLRAIGLRTRAAPAGAERYLGQNAWVAFARFFIWQSESETALAESALATKIDLPVKGLLFKWIDVSGHEIPSTKLSIAEAVANLEDSQTYYGQSEDIFANPGNLFEDVESAFVINMFRKSDLSLFYVLTELRKRINANVRDFSIWTSLILVTVLLANVFFDAIVGQDPKDPSRVTLGDHPEAVFAALSCAAGILLISAAYLIFYVHHQRNNGMQLNNFVQRYLSHLNRIYQEAQRHAGAEQLDQRAGNIEDIVKSAGAWFLNFQWTAMRVFFVETFARNVLFQVRRNSGFYAFYIPLSFLAALIALASLLDIGELDVLSRNARIYDMSVVFYVGYGVMGLVFLRMLAFPVNAVLEQIQSQSWERFAKMNLQGSTQALVQRDKREIANWKNRFRNEMA